MPHVELRLKAGQKSPQDIRVTVQDKTFDYLMSSDAPEIRVSTYIDQDILNVEAEYAELFVHENCKFLSQVTKLIPGSRVRSGITLPGPMKEGEQLVVLVSRTAL